MEPERKLVLDVSGKDRAAVSIMHAYLAARGVSPEEVMANRPEGLGAHASVVEAAQKLATDPRYEPTGCVCAPAQLADLGKRADGRDVVAAIIRVKERPSR